MLHETIGAKVEGKRWNKPRMTTSIGGENELVTVVIAADESRSNDLP
jgi:hypothetical protein